MKDTDLKPWNCLLCRPEGPLICRAGKDASALPCMEQGGLPERLSGDESHAGGTKKRLFGERRFFLCSVFHHRRRIPYFRAWGRPRLLRSETAEGGKGAVFARSGGHGRFPEQPPPDSGLPPLFRQP